MDAFENLTELGQKTLTLFKTYGLLEYYQFEAGTAVFYPDDITPDIQNKIFIFLKENPQFVLGFEESYYYISRSDESN